MPTVSSSSRTTDVLVVDDNHDMRRVLVRLLEHAGYAVVAAAGGADALARLRERPVGLVILDYTMPEMDGLTVLRAIRADPGLRDVRVLMFSALNDPARQDEAAQIGAAGWLVKGAVTFPKVLAAVAACAAGVK